MSKSARVALFSLFLLSASFLDLFFYAKTAKAQIPQLKLPCSAERDNEFHSLRPYQAAPCGDANKAYYCSNDLIFIESFDVAGRNDCVARGYDGTFTCHPDLNVPPHDLFVELDESMFPIMGNTEQVKNSQNSSDELDDATKVNEYASWFLSGVNGRAEYGEATDDQTVNFSGPVQKLLPQAIAQAQRIKTIESATKEVPVTDEDTGTTSEEPQTHNQIVVCEEGGKAVECPNGEKLRLKDWDDGSLSIINTFFNWLGGDIWNKKYPPLPWQFKEEILYRKAYSEWQGKNCAILPIAGLQCLDTPVSNKWADLFSYVPLGNTTDKKGAEMITGVEIKPTKGTEIAGQGYGEVRNAPLYFAHTEEVRQLSETLNKTYQPAGYESKPVPETTEFNNCSVVNVRTNQGDNLFPGDPDEIQVPDVTYEITEAECKETYKEEYKCYKTTNKCADGNYCCTQIISNLACNAQVYVTIKTLTKTPSAQEIFDQTVADSGSIFRKIYPKVDENAPVDCIADIPTVTKVTYDPEDSQPPPGGSQEFKVKKHPEDGGGDSPELTFPHIGSVYEYFLKGIQTALRPKGYGEQPISGNCATAEEKGDCSFNMNKINQAMQKAADKYGVPVEIMRAIFEIEMADEIVDPSSYECKENSATAMGVAQVTRDTYQYVTCDNERMADIGMCGDYGEKLSRCNIENAFELMARVLLWKAGKQNQCSSFGGMSLSNKTEWYNATCNYYGSFEPDDLTINYANEIPASEKRPDGDMNYCDIVCWKVGACPSYPAR